MHETEIRERLRTYIIENFLYAEHHAQLQDDDRLLDRGIIDSMGVLEVVGFLESEFAVLVDDQDITEQHMGSVESLARYVAAKRAAARQT